MENHVWALQVFINIIWTNKPAPLTLVDLHLLNVAIEFCTSSVHFESLAKLYKMRFRKKVWNYSGIMLQFNSQNWIFRKFSCSSSSRKVNRFIKLEISMRLRKLYCKWWKECFDLVEKLNQVTNFVLQHLLQRKLFGFYRLWLYSVAICNTV